MYIAVRVQAGAKKEVVKKTDDDNYEIRVKEKAQQNNANRRIQQILAEEYNCPVKQVRLLAGHRSTKKIFAVPDNYKAK